jgi:UDP-glucose 4-epimerase
MAASELDLDGIYNVGTGLETSVNALYDALTKALGIDAKPAYAPAKAGEQVRRVLDGSKLRSIAKLPEPVTLDEGLGRVVAWLRSR